MQSRMPTPVMLTDFQFHDLCTGGRCRINETYGDELTTEFKGKFPFSWREVEVQLVPLPVFLEPEKRIENAG